MKQFAATLAFSLSLITSALGQWTSFDPMEGGPIQDMTVVGPNAYALSENYIFQMVAPNSYWEPLPASENVGVQFNQLGYGNGVFYARKKNDELWRSTDNGQNWEHILGPNFPKNYLGQGVRSFYVYGDTILVATQFDVFRSTNKGEDWASVGDFVLEKAKAFFHYRNEIFAWGGASIFRSSDGGKTWVKAYAIASVFPFVGATERGIWAIYESGDMVFSSDGLRTWQLHSPTINASSHDIRGLHSSGDSLFLAIQKFSVSPGICGSSYLFSTNNGKDWQQWPANSHLPMQFILESNVLPDGRLLLASERGVGAVKGSEKPFQPLNFGLTVGKVLDFVPHDGQIFALGASTFQRLDVATGTWFSLPLPHPEIACGKDARIYANTNCLLYKSSIRRRISRDNGQNWESPPPVFNSTDMVLTQNYLVGFSGSAFIRWNTTSGKRDTLRFSTASGLSSINGLVARDHLIFGFSGSEKSFVVCTEDLNVLGKYPPLILCPESNTVTLRYFYDNETAWAFCDDWAYRFNEDTKEWEEYGYRNISGEGESYIEVKDVETTTTDRLLWLTNHGLLLSNSAEKNMYPLSPEFPRAIIDRIKVVRDTIWVLDNTDNRLHMMPMTNDQTGLSNQLKLQAYPSPTTSIVALQADEFFITQPQLEVVDIAGRVVLTQRLPAGRQWQVDLSPLPRGVYFLRMRGNSGWGLVKVVRG